MKSADDVKDKKYSTTMAALAPKKPAEDAFHFSEKQGKLSKEG